MKLINIMMPRSAQGFTLIELMITVVVASILLTLAIPSFQNTIRQNRFATQANEFITALNLARSEAIRRGERVSVTPVGGNWTGGWTVTITASGDMLRTFEALGNNLTIAGGAASYTYLPSGFKLNANTDLYSLCDSSVSGERGRQIRVSATGRPRVTTNNPC